MKVERTDVKKPFAIKTELMTSEATLADADYPKKVGYKRLNVGAIKDLVLAPDDNNYIEVCVDIIAGFIEVDPRILTSMDFEKILLSLRVNSCGRYAEYTVACGKCGNNVNIRVDLKNFKMIAVPSDFKEPHKTKTGINLGLPRVSSVIEVEQMEDLSDLERLALYILDGDTLEEKLKVFNNADPMLIPELKDFASTVQQWGIKSIHRFKCTKNLGTAEKLEMCGAEEEISIPFRCEFFLPIESEGDTRETI